MMNSSNKAAGRPSIGAGHLPRTPLALHIALSASRPSSQATGSSHRLGFPSPHDS